jgi:hypothetical protein
MKRLTLILCAASFLGSLTAAPPEVQITDLNHCTVNGLPRGTVVDAIVNVPDSAGAVLDWLNAREKLAASQASKLSDAEARASAAEKAAAAQLNKLKDAEGRALLAEQKARELEGQIALRLNGELASGEGPKTKLLRDLLTEAQKPQREKRAKELAAEIAQKKRELESLK